MDLVSFSIMLLTTPAWEAASSSDCNRSCTTSIVLSAAVSMLSRVCLGAYNDNHGQISVKSVYNIKALVKPTKICPLLFFSFSRGIYK